MIDADILLVLKWNLLIIDKGFSKMESFPVATIVFLEGLNNYILYSKVTFNSASSDNYMTVAN